MLFAEWTGKRVVKEIEFDGAHGEIVAKKPFAYHSPRIELPPMPRGKIDLQKVLASLNTTCPKCCHQITPAEIKRVSRDEIECPKCGVQFDPQKPR